VKPKTKGTVVQTPIQERLNALQDELDRILSADAASKKDIVNLADFDLEGLVHLVTPQLEAIDRALNGMLRNTKGFEEVYPNRPPLDLGSIAVAIYEAKKCAYLIGVIVGLRMMGTSRESINDLLFDSKKYLEPR
jgi:hypothetical protein